MFDSLSGDTLLATLRENPWDTWTIDITVTDHAFVEHLPSTIPFNHNFIGVTKPKPWNNELLTSGA